MPVYISMLRGINVGPHNKIKMDRLRESFEALGFEQVKTYVQSGNVVFKTAKRSTSDLSKKIEERVLKDFGYSVPVISKTAEEMGKTIQNNPFLTMKGIDASKLHVTFLSQVPGQPALKKLDALVAGSDEFHYWGNEIYLYCPNGYGRTKLSNNALERVLGVRATTRNWRTVNNLYQISLDYN
jgi:uncharacterized protein (DUF1697 family)